MVGILHDVYNELQHVKTVLLVVS